MIDYIKNLANKINGSFIISFVVTVECFDEGIFLSLRDVRDGKMTSKFYNHRDMMKVVNTLTLIINTCNLREDSELWMTA